jgi:hypothetical protein
MCYRWSLCVFNVHQTLTPGTLRLGEIHRVLVRALRCAMSVTLSFSSISRCSWRLARRFLFWKEPFSLRNLWTRVNTSRSGTRRRRYRYRHSSTAVVALPLKNANTKCIFVYSSWENDMIRVTCTVYFSQHELSAPFLSHVLLEFLWSHE